MGTLRDLTYGAGLGLLGWLLILVGWVGLEVLKALWTGEGWELEGKGGKDGPVG